MQQKYNETTKQSNPNIILIGDCIIYFMKNVYGSLIKCALGTRKLNKNCWGSLNSRGSLILISTVIIKNDAASGSPSDFLKFSFLIHTFSTPLTILANVSFNIIFVASLAISVPVIPISLTSSPVVTTIPSNFCTV